MVIIKIEYNGEKQYCAVESNSSFVDIAKKVVDNFNLNIQNAEISIVDHQDAEIKSVEALHHVIQKCSENIDLYIKVGFGNSSRVLLAPQILLKFISESGGSKMAQVLNLHKSTGQLTISQRRLILHSVIDYMIREYGYYPNRDVKIEVAKVVISLFPCLAKKQGDNVIEFLYAGRKGWLVTSLKARRAKDNVKRPQNVNDDDDADDADDDDSESIEYSAQEALQDVEYLKMTVYEKNTANLIEEKLKLTSKYRHNLLDAPGVNVVKQFPFMIIHPHLILLDYSFMHPSNSTTFTEKWPIYSKYIIPTLTLYEKNADFYTCFSSEIGSMLALLKLVTPKPKGRGRKNNNNDFFQKIVDDFITFLPIGTAPKNELKKNFNQPYIFASGHDQKRIIQYFIVVEREIITVPTSFSFDAVFDLYFKLHFVFNIEYGENIKFLMEFIEAFIYESGMVDTTDQMDQMFETLIKQIPDNEMII